MTILSWKQLDNLADRPLRFRKEAIFAGDFNKDGEQFSVSKQMLQRLAASVKELRKAGVEVPLANGHDDWMNAANRLGDVVDASVENNDDGVPALFLDVEFADPNTAAIATKADVSIGYLGEFLDGRGVLHKSVLRHVAATSAPVIPSLSDWAALAASFNTKDTSMSKIFELLGVANEELALSAIAELQKAAKPAEKIELSYPAEVVTAMKDARHATLDALVVQGEIGPVIRDHLFAKHCTDQCIGLELSHKNTDGFKAALELARLASKNPPVKTHGRSTKPTAGEIELSHNGGQQSGLATIIDQMAKDHAARFGRN